MIIDCDGCQMRDLACDDCVVTFLLGFLLLWIALIVLGTFLRGPNWSFFGIYEHWDKRKLEVLFISR